MKVTQIYVANYRNLQTQKIFPQGGLNIFVGDNAQGKTNLVESVCLCCLGKSPRTDKDKDLICWGKKDALVKVNYLCKYGEGEIEIRLFSDARKKIAVNSVPVAKTGELMGYLNCVYFSPDEIKIISQSPAERRRFLDIDLCQTDKNYFYSLLKHNKALAQRNNALKQAKNIKDARDAVLGWNQVIAEEGARIIAKRRRFCEKLKGYAQTCHAKLTDGKETFFLQYLSKIEGETVKQIYEKYLEALENSVEKDFQLRYTTVGCQRDDLQIKIDDVDVRTFGSRGQLRTAALTLKLAELTVFKNLTGEYPVLILDDVLSELDPDRQKRLMSLDGEIQIFLTSATQVANDGAKHFVIEKGMCKEQ